MTSCREERHNLEIPDLLAEAHDLMGALCISARLLQVNRIGIFL
jgi:hypothetical protein